MKVKYREIEGLSDVTIVRHQDGGFGWRVRDNAGVPLRLHVGKMIDLESSSPQSVADYETSLRVIDIALKRFSVAKGKKDKHASGAATHMRLKTGFKRKRINEGRMASQAK